MPLEITQEVRDRLTAKRLAKEFESKVITNNMAFRFGDELIDKNTDVVLKLMVKILTERGRIYRRPDAYWERSY